jgi:sulfatase modifying factor 1
VRLAVALFVVTTGTVWACSSSSTNAPGTGGAAGASTGGGDTGGTDGGGNTGGTDGGAMDGGGLDGAGNTGGTDGGKPDAGFSCPTGKKGPALVNAGTFCIDATEVTNQNYQDFLDDSSTKPPPSAGCTGNDLVPSTDGNLNCPTFALSSAPSLPVVCVDWCDAQAYCVWAGKRLCGAMNGTSVLFADKNNPAVSEWYSACSGGGTDTYIYGSSYNDTQCAGDTTGHIVEVLQLNKCTGIWVPGLYGMNGNAAEWEDACSDPTAPTANCLVRGGSFMGGENELKCTATVEAVRSSYAADRGFRCCWDSSLN